MRLSKRSRAVARHLLRGWKYGAIAKELNIGHESLKTNCAQEILDATGQDSALNAVLFILRSPKWLSYVMQIDKGGRE